MNGNLQIPLETIIVESSQDIQVDDAKPEAIDPVEILNESTVNNIDLEQYKQEDDQPEINDKILMNASEERKKNLIEQR